MTSPGTALGTVAYMSPEQARGEELDARTDLFSLGAVLYEMAVRRPAFAGDTSAVIFDAILNRASAAAREANRSLPGKLEEIIGKLLEKDRDFRYQGAAEVRADLKRLRRDADSGRAAEAAAAKSPGHKSGRAAAVSKTIDSLAVLPFENASGDAANDYLSEGITEQIINTLPKLPKIRVVPRGIVFRYRGKNVDPLGAAGELNVRAVVTGRVLQHKDTLIVKAELVDVIRQDQLWGESYNRKVADLLEVQDDIAREIARHLEQRLGSEGAKRAPRRAAENPEAYRLYLQGTHQVRRWLEEGIRKGIDFFQQAIALDPAYAPSYAGLSYALVMMGFYGFLPGKEAFPKSKAAAEKALELDPLLAEPHVALTMYAQEFVHDHHLALREAHRAVELKPDLAIAHHALSIVLNICRRSEEALAAVRKAVELDPLTPLFQAHEAWILHCLHRDEEALRVLHSALEIFPTDYYLLRIQVYCCNVPGHGKEAIAAGEKIVALTQRRPIDMGLLGFDYPVAGRREEAERLIPQLQEDASRYPVLGYWLGSMYVTLGDKEKAMDWLEKAFEAGLGLLLIINVEPAFDPLRSEPRFLALLRNLGFSA